MQVGDAEGFGDLLDDFVLAATTAPAEEAEGAGDASASSVGESYASSEYESEEEEEREEGEGRHAGAGGSDAGTGRSGGRAPTRSGSIASTYWREERHDRRNLLTVIDEK